jgi:hypothetical protein
LVQTCAVAGPKTNLYDQPMSEPDLECGKLGPAFQSGGKPPHSKDQGKRTFGQTFSNVALIFNDL